MAKCPICEAEVGDDFGLIDCSKCGNPLFLEMDGSVKAMGANPAPPLANPSLPDVELPMPEMEFDASAAEGTEIELDMDAAGSEQPPPPPRPNTVSSFMHEEVADATAVVEGQDSLLDPVPEMEIPAETAQNLSEVAVYGNSEISRGQDGGLFYKVTIEGIDSYELKSLVREVLEDRKFLWDYEGLVRSIKSGTLELENVTAVKAAILIQRLQELPLIISWEQHSIHEA